MIDSIWGTLSSEDFSHLEVMKKVAPEAVQGILASCEMKSLGKGEILFEKGASTGELYLILEGELEVRLTHDRAISTIKLSVGQTVGELSVIDHRPSSAEVAALCFTRVLIIPEEMFWRLIDVSHEFSRNMLILLSQRMRSDDTLIQESISIKNMFELQSTQDPLTGLHNRRWIDQNLPKLIQRARFGGESLAVMMIDIDHFKQVNDQYGHLKGDLVLRMVAQTISSSIRPYDFACRYGGEEFMVIFPRTEAEHACIPAERIRSNVERRSAVAASEVGTPPVTITGGVAVVHADEIAADASLELLTEELIAQADRSLYEGKEGGRNRIIQH